MLKELMKKMIREDYWRFASWYRDRFGLLAAVASYIRLLDNGIGTAPNPLNGPDVILRPGTADQDVYDEIFGAREYDVELGDPSFIVDAGAHIGLSSVFFACRFPKATVVAIEPEPSNFDILLRNVRQYENIKPIKAGLWSGKTHLRIQDPEVATWSFRVSEDPTGIGIPAIGIKDVLADFHVEHIDILKLDIEGSELEVLNNSESWIDSVRALVVEMHDRYRAGCTESLHTALRNHAYEKSISRESIVLTNLRRIAT